MWSELNVDTKQTRLDRLEIMLTSRTASFAEEAETSKPNPPVVFAMRTSEAHGGASAPPPFLTSIPAHFTDDRNWPWSEWRNTFRDPV